MDIILNFDFIDELRKEYIKKIILLKFHPKN